MNKPTFTESALRTIEMEAKAVQMLGNRIDGRFTDACNLILKCTGRVVVTGMGKSHHIASKIAATLSSTGTPAFFVHPAEASHGDLGMITPGDTVLALSNSGNTAELITLLPLFKRLGIPLISMTGNPQSTLAKTADVNLDTSVEVEACPLDLAPTSSTTVAMVMGDALAIALLEARGFSAEDFAFSHPGGTLGKQLLLKVSDVMHTKAAMPNVPSGSRLDKALLEVSGKGLGMTIITDSNNNLLGIFTDGDLRRAIDNGMDIHNVTIDEAMTTNCKTARADMLAAEALRIMDDYKISEVVVLEDNTLPIGVICLKDLLKAGVA